MIKLAGGCHALPGTVRFHPGVDESLAMRIWLALIGTFDAEDADDHSGVTMYSDAALLGDRLRRQIISRKFGVIREWTGKGRKRGVL